MPVNRDGARQHVYYAADNRLDAAHAERLEWAELHRFDHARHDLVTVLRDSGRLETLLVPFRDRPLVVAFGGIRDGVGLPPKEFFGILSRLGIRAHFLTDPQRAWYHLGTDGFPDIRSLAAHLRSYCDERAVFIGNSAGGYAALLFGRLLGFEAHAFSPQTFISAELREKYGDTRWAVHIAGFKPDPRYADLMTLPSLVPRARLVAP